MNRVKCPGCGQPLAKRSRKGKYYCETESCPIIFVKCPFNADIRRIIYKPSANQSLVGEIERSPVEIV